MENNKGINWKTLIICLLIPLAVGGASAFLITDSMKRFAELNQPALSPPGWLFPIVWTVLYVLMGIASYLVYTSGDDRGAVRTALTVYGVQLAMNFVWPLLFFNMGAYLFAFVWLVVLWVLILITLVLFYRIRRGAGWLMLPYLLWTAFAGYLNLFIFILN